MKKNLFRFTAAILILMCLWTAGVAEDLIVIGAEKVIAQNETTLIGDLEVRFSQPVCSRDGIIWVDYAHSVLTAELFARNWGFEDAHVNIEKWYLEYQHKYRYASPFFDDRDNWLIGSFSRFSGNTGDRFNTITITNFEPATGEVSATFERFTSKGGSKMMSYCHTGSYNKKTNVLTLTKKSKNFDDCTWSVLEKITNGRLMVDLSSKDVSLYIDEEWQKENYTDVCWTYINDSINSKTQDAIPMLAEDTYLIYFVIPNRVARDVYGGELVLHAFFDETEYLIHITELEELL